MEKKEQNIPVMITSSNYQRVYYKKPIILIKYDKFYKMLFHIIIIFFGLSQVLKAERPDVDEKRSDLLKLQGIA